MDDIETDDPHLADLLTLRRISRGSESEAYTWPKIIQALQVMILVRQKQLAEADIKGNVK